ncbi:MAG: DUF4402 domain-containing protein, partial [Fluviicola sp.]|nr:DUF4402 domain-containing protein [Fluviicola sp.]
AGALFVVAFSTTYAQSTASADASARIVSPLQITKTADLKFGNIAAGPAAGTVDMAITDVRSATGGVTLISAGNVSNAAAFDIIGYPDATFTISLPSTILIASGANDMQVDNFVSSLGATSALDAQGESALKVGATLNVDANQPVGLYTGSFDVTVAYN